jgi:hypothetical protein
MSTSRKITEALAEAVDIVKNLFLSYYHASHYEEGDSAMIALGHPHKMSNYQNCRNCGLKLELQAQLLSQMPVKIGSLARSRKVSSDFLQDFSS